MHAMFARAYLSKYVMTRYKGYSFEATPFVHRKGSVMSVRNDSSTSLCEVSWEYARTTHICFNRH